MKLIHATTADIDYIMTLENTPENVAHIDQWPQEQHEEAFASEQYDYYILYNEAGAKLGYIIARLEPDEERVKLQRIVIEEKNQGQGTKAVDAFIEAYRDEPYKLAYVHVKGGYKPLVQFYHRNGFDEDVNEDFDIYGYTALSHVF